MGWVKTLLVVFVESCCVRVLVSKDFVITNTPGFGSSVMINGISVEDEDAYSYRSSGYSPCKCKMGCFSWANCTMVSIKMADGSLAECLFYKQEFLRTKMKKSKNNTQKELLVAKNEKKKNTNTNNSPEKFDDFFGQDGMVYRVNYTTRTLDSGQEECANLPNGRMVITKTLEQWQSLLDFRKSIGKASDGYYFLVNLKTNSEGEAVFGDGTKFLDTELSLHVHLENPDGVLEPVYEAVTTGGKMYLWARSPLKKTWLICQINPLLMP